MALCCIAAQLDRWALAIRNGDVRQQCPSHSRPFSERLRSVGSFVSSCQPVMGEEAAGNVFARAS